MLDRIFRHCDGLEDSWWIIILFVLFLGFSDCWCDMDICDWIPFLIILLIVCSFEDLRSC